MDALRLQLRLQPNRQSDNLPRNKDGKVGLSTFQKLRLVITWQQIFQTGFVSVSFVAGAGVGREVLHEPLATAEGVLNYPVVLSQFAVIFTEVFLLGSTVCASSIYGEIPLPLAGLVNAANC